VTAHVVQSFAFRRFSITERLYAPGVRQPRHAHVRSSITAVMSGEIVETTETAAYLGRSCSVVVKPAGTLHADEFRGRVPVRTISIELDATSDGCAELLWRSDDASARAAIALCAALRNSRAEVEAAAEALIAVSRTSVTASHIGGSPARATRTPQWLAQIKTVLDTRFDEPLRFDELARDAGLHPVYLARAFRRATGMTMGDYVRSARLRHARHLLAVTNAPLAAIASASGFADPSHLCRTFTRAMHLTPIAFRGLARSSAR
jgi:AraC family transcriptional regulator